MFEKKKSKKVSCYIKKKIVLIGKKNMENGKKRRNRYEKV